MDRYFCNGKLLRRMESKPPFLRINLRAMAQATEVEDRVRRAVVFASGSGEPDTEIVKGHFGNPIILFNVEISRARAMKDFLERLRASGILALVMEQVEQRLDEDCVVHLRLEKQLAFEETLALATSRDVIDVAMKVAAYPARREIALEAAREWFGEF